MDLGLAFADKAPASVTDQVFEALYKAVVAIDLPPGTKVSEADIAKQMGVSRQPVRDAFFRLSDLGFLSIRPQRATVITRISQRAVLDAVFIRTALEAECLRVAMAAHPAELVDALQANLAAHRGLTTDDRDRFHAFDEAFHEAICVASGHAHVWSLIRAQKAHLDRIRYLTLSSDRKATVIAEHEGILQAIIESDAAMAEQRLRDHIKDVLPKAKAIEAEMPDYFEPL